MHSQTTKFLRGAIYYGQVEGFDEPKYFVVVSNNRRNEHLGTALAVRITTTLKRRDLPSMVEIPDGEPVTGVVVCDDILLLYPEDPLTQRSAFTPRTLRLIEDGLRHTLAL